MITNLPVALRRRADLQPMTGQPLTRKQRKKIRIGIKYFKEVAYILPALYRLYLRPMTTVMNVTIGIKGIAMGLSMNGTYHDCWMGFKNGTYMVDSCLLLSLPALVLIPWLNTTILI